MISTAMTEKLGIKYPIVGGAMMRISKPGFVAAVSNAGGIGVMASANYRTEQEFRDAIKQVKDLTDKPVAVNLNLFPAMRPIDNSVYLKVLVEEGIKVVETSGHKAPAELAESFKAEGMFWIHKCVGLRYAQTVEKLGADMVTVVGYENGGATGVLDIGTLALVPRVAGELKIPVIGGGGVSDGRGVAAILALGAAGVIIGTRLMATQECPIHQNVKQALLDAQEVDTMLLMRTIGNTHRVWKNKAAQAVAELEEKKATLEEIVKAAGGEKAEAMYDTGVTDVGIMSCGQGVGMIHDIPTIAELLDRMMEQAEQSMKKVLGV